MEKRNIEEELNALDESVSVHEWRSIHLTQQVEDIRRCVVSIKSCAETLKSHLPPDYATSSNLLKEIEQKEEEIAQYQKRDRKLAKACDVAKTRQYNTVSSHTAAINIHENAWEKHIVNEEIFTRAFDECGLGCAHLRETS
ncbi:MAG TPA: hypothetical protein O0W88_03980 [Methanocorpusculum sp.]|nr:hypothetical protein [Methanocorpusculum sp.]